MGQHSVAIPPERPGTENPAVAGNLHSTERHGIPLITTRNEGVPGSSPGVGSSQKPANGAGAWAPDLWSMATLLATRESLQ